VEAGLKKLMASQFHYNIQLENLDIVEIIEKETGLQIDRAKRRPKILCPFHNDHDPSLTIFPETQSFYCFGCQIGGNAINFLMHLNKLSDFKDGIKLAIEKGYIRDVEVKKEEKDHFYYERLSELPIHISKWLRERTLTEETIYRFGLCAFKDNNGNLWLGIPLRNERGEIVNFKLRRDPYSLRENNDLPKYKFLLSNQEHMLFPLNLLDFNKNIVYICEGELDVILLHQEGYNAITHTGGARTKWKKEWIDVIKKFQKTFIISDNDEAGIEMFNELKEKISWTTRQIFRVKLPEGVKDITEAYQKGFKLENLEIERIKGKIVTLRELKENSSSNEVVSLPFLGLEGIILKGFTHLVGAFPKTGKTELFFRLALDWAQNGLKVLYLSEESEKIWRRRVKGMDFTEEINENFALIPLALIYDKQNLFDIIEGFNPEIVVIDTIRSTLGSLIDDETKANEVNNLFYPLLKSVQEKEITLICLHHLTKAAQTGEENFKPFAGSHSLVGLFDVIIRIDDIGGNKRKVFIKGRTLGEERSFIYQRQGGNFEIIERVEVGNPIKDIKAILEELSDIFSLRFYTTTEVEKIIEGSKGFKTKREDLIRALKELAEEGKWERLPKEDRRGATYRWKAKNNRNSEDRQEENALSTLDLSY
jgi:5S rRNA maturation endonuclease (ribonuclease M5)